MKVIHSTFKLYQYFDAQYRKVVKLRVSVKVFLKVVFSL